MTMISTTHGLMPESALRRVEGSLDDDNELTFWQEYYLGDELVHRSVQVNLKRGANIGALISNIG